MRDNVRERNLVVVTRGGWLSLLYMWSSDGKTDRTRANESWRSGLGGVLTHGWESARVENAEFFKHLS
jgi:hypothetical protein